MAYGHHHLSLSCHERGEEEARGSGTGEKEKWVRGGAGSLLAGGGEGKKGRCTAALLLPFICAV